MYGSAIAGLGGRARAVRAHLPARQTRGPRARHRGHRRRGYLFLNDLGYASSVLPSTGQLGALGFLGIAAGGGSTLLSRYVAATAEVAKKNTELRTRTRDLRKALADLESAEEELGRKEQLAVVGELAAVIIAHGEVRNPLAIIANAASPASAS